MSHLGPIQNAAGYGSEFESDCEADRKRKSQQGDMSRPEKRIKHKMPSKQEVSTEYTKEEGRAHRFHFTSLDAYSRHKKLVNDYILYYGGNWADFKREPRTCKSDLDIVRENQQFLWDDDATELSWEKRIAKKYYDKLFKEYCIADLSRYKENAIALRWRVENEVVEGKGQFICGSKKCEERKSLRSWEVNFGYRENGQKKNALVKLRLCTECSYRVNYHHKKRELTKNPTSATSSGVVRKEVYEGSAESGKKNTAEQTGVTSERSTSEKKGNIWRGPAKIVEDKTRNDEFDEYFEDMFL